MSSCPGCDWANENATEGGSGQRISPNMEKQQERYGYDSVYIY